nr:hypothetical protein [Tanacetum cinerariifolium]
RKDWIFYPNGDIRFLPGERIEVANASSRRVLVEFVVEMSLDCFDYFDLRLRSRFFPDFTTKNLLNLLLKKNCLGEHFLQSSVGEYLGKQHDLIDLGNLKLKSCGDKTTSTRNMINLHTIRDDSLLGTLKVVSKTQDYQHYGALIPDDMINPDIKVLDASKDKSTGINEGTGAKLGVLDVPKYLSESQNKSWGDSGDDGSNDDEEEYNEIYKDVDVQSLNAKREKEKRGDAEIIDANNNVS